MVRRTLDSQEPFIYRVCDRPSGPMHGRLRTAVQSLWLRRLFLACILRVHFFVCILRVRSVAFCGVRTRRAYGWRGGEFRRSATRLWIMSHIEHWLNYLKLASPYSRLYRAPFLETLQLRDTDSLHVKSIKLSIFLSKHTWYFLVLAQQFACDTHRRIM